MTPSTVLTPTTPQGRPSSLDTGAAVSRLSQRLRLRQHPPELSPADAVSTPARPLQRPNRVHLRLGPVFCLGILSTPHRGFPRHDAVSLSYPPLTCHRRTQTCTGWFHGFISVRRAGVPPASEGVFARREYRTLTGSQDRGGILFPSGRHGTRCYSRRAKTPSEAGGTPALPRGPCIRCGAHSHVQIRAHSSDS